MSLDQIQPGNDKDSLEKIVFLYHPSQKKIAFSSGPVTALGVNELNDLPSTFTSTANNDAQDFSKYWTGDFTLKAGEEKQFLINTRNGTYNIEARGIDAGDTGAPAILFIMEEAEPADGSAALRAELENLRARNQEFIDHAAHDLHAPLRKLTVFVEKLAAKIDNVAQEDTRMYIQRINGCVSNMRALIDRLTSLSHAESGPGDMNACDLHELVTQLVKEMESDAAARNITFIVGKLPTVMCDEALMHDLFKNLVNNGIVYAKKDEAGSIDISTMEITDDEIARFKISRADQYVKIVVKDNGIGFPKEYNERIFDPFVRLHSSSAGTGTGLGLHISKKIVSKHNGFIYAEGEENSGSRFILILPQTLNT